MTAISLGERAKRRHCADTLSGFRCLRYWNSPQGDLQGLSFAPARRFAGARKGAIMPCLPPSPDIRGFSPAQDCVGQCGRVFLKVACNDFAIEFLGRVVGDCARSGEQVDHTIGVCGCRTKRLPEPVQEHRSLGAHVLHVIRTRRGRWSSGEPGIARQALEQGGFARTACWEVLDYKIAVLESHFREKLGERLGRDNCGSV